MNLTTKLLMGICIPTFLMASLPVFAAQHLVAGDTSTNAIGTDFSNNDPTSSTSSGYGIRTTTDNGETTFIIDVTDDITANNNDWYAIHASNSGKITFQGNGSTTITANNNKNKIVILFGNLLWKPAFYTNGAVTQTSRLLKPSLNQISVAPDMKLQLA